VYVLTLKTEKMEKVWVGSDKVDSCLKSHKNLFSRSKSREKMSGTVPATKGGTSTLKGSKSSAFDDNGLITVFIDTDNHPKKEVSKDKFRMSSRDLKIKWYIFI